MQKLLIGILLTHAALGCLLSTFSAPWWLILFTTLLVWSSTALEAEDANELNSSYSGCLFYGSCLFRFLLLCLWVAGIGLLILSIFLLNGQSKTSDANTELHGVTPLFTYLFFFAFRAPDFIMNRIFEGALKLANAWKISPIQRDIDRAFKSTGKQWIWMIPIIVSGFLMLVLPNYVTAPFFVFPALEWRGLNTLSAVFEFVSRGLHLGLYFVDFADAAIAFGVAWVASVYYTVPAARQWLSQFLSPLRSSLVLLAVASAGLGMGWAFAAQYRTLLTAILTMTLGIYVLCWGIFLVIRDGNFYRNAKPATGIVTNLMKQGNAYFPKFQFADVTGKQWAVVSEIGSNPCSYKAGDEVNILYNLNAAPIAKINSHTSLLLIGLITLLIVALGLFMIGLSINALLSLLPVRAPLP